MDFASYMLCQHIMAVSIISSAVFLMTPLS